MKKIIKAALSGALVMGMLAAQCFSTSAMIRPIMTGNVDWNSKVDVNDVTLLQNALAGSAEIDNVKTDTGKTYEIIYGLYATVRDHPEYEGVTDLLVILTV